MYNYEKVASSSLKEAKDILRDIYEENPKHWPHGLYPEQMDGGLYLVREASTKEPVGFVGWQERIEDFKKIGYYSVGIKQAHRRSGYAKAAVKKLIQEKSARVDRVKALIVEGNEPSVGLAENLEVEVDLKKSAALIPVSGLAGLLYGAAAGPKGEKAESMAHGGARGLGFGLGGVGGAMAGGALSNLSQKYRPTTIRGAGALRQTLLMLGGMLAGAPVGRGLMGSALGKAPYEKNAAAKFLTGAALGGGASLLENEWLGYEPGTSKINAVLGALSGGVISKYLKGSPAIATAGLLGYPAKSVGLYGVDQLAKARKEQTDLMDKKLETAENYKDMAGLLSPYESDPDNPDSNRVKPLYAAAGLGIGALGTGAVFASVVNALRDKNKITVENKDFKDPNVLSVDIPKDKVSDKFYTNLNRDMLFATPEEKREKLKDLLEDIGDSKEAMEKQAFAALGRGLLQLGKGLGKAAPHVGKGLYNTGAYAGKGVRAVGGNVADAAARTGRAINPLNSNSIYRHPRFKRSLAQYGIGHGSLYAGDAVGLTEAIGDKFDDLGIGDPRKKSGDWGNRFAKYLYEPVKDSARDFRAGNYMAGLGNALYAPIHFGMNASMGAGLGKHLVKNTGRLMSGGGKLMAGKGSQQLSNLGLRQAQTPGMAKQLLNPMLSRSNAATMGSTNTQIYGNAISDLGRKIYGSGLARGHADTLLTPMLQGYGRMLGGNNMFGRGLGNIATAAGTISNPALRSGMMGGGKLSRTIASKPGLLLPMSLGSSYGLGTAGYNNSREGRMYNWEAEQAKRNQEIRENIAADEANVLNNPEYMVPMMRMLFGEYDGGYKYGT